MCSLGFLVPSLFIPFFFFFFLVCLFFSVAEMLAKLTLMPTYKPLSLPRVASMSSWAKGLMGGHVTEEDL